MTTPAPSPEPTKRSKRLYILWAIALVAAGLLATGICVWNWKPIVVFAQCTFTAAEFRSIYRDPSKPHIMKGELDWMLEFGGTASLEVLDAMAKDASFSAQGRSYAASLRRKIAAGEHLVFMKMEMKWNAGKYEENPEPTGTWYRQALIEYIYEQDLKALGLTDEEVSRRLSKLEQAVERKNAAKSAQEKDQK
jgi:hypothetical protein